MLEALQKIQPIRPGPTAEEGPLSIVYEDDALLVLDKPAGIVIHPTYKNTTGTLLNAVMWHVRHRPDARPGILTRLDKDTSGLVVIALWERVHAVMQRDAAAGLVTKEYLAVVDGVPEPPSGRITLPLARDPQDRRRVIATPDGAPAETRYEVLETRGTESIVRCELVTGRTHQIRVHLAANGWPIVGDAVYNADLSLRQAQGHPEQGGGVTGCAPHTIARQALHAWRVTLPHPVMRDTLRVEAPVPPDIKRLIEPADLERRSSGRSA
jgi:23S rRNA pseudouridine1911/1915/1917 synthase